MCLGGLTCQPLNLKGADAGAPRRPVAGGPADQQYDYGYCTLPGAEGAVAAVADQGPAAVLVAQRTTISGKPCRLPLLYRRAAL